MLKVLEFLSHLGRFWVKCQLLGIHLNKAHKKKALKDSPQPNGEHITWIILKLFAKKKKNLVIGISTLIKHCSALCLILE